MVAACTSREEAPVQPDFNTAPEANGSAPAQTQPEGPDWVLQSGGGGALLTLSDGAGGVAIRLACAPGREGFLVNVPAFRPIGSEERLSFGSGGEVVALVADTRGDAQRGGVTGTGAIPDELPALLAGPISAVYGAQRSGPHPALTAETTRAFVAACGAVAPAPPSPPGNDGNVSACLIQGNERLRVTPLRVVGTEPFWAARIEGRCVTYSHPEDQAGTRVWTRYTPGPNGGGTWSGALDGRLFELRARPEPGCSDGMSDRSYPIAVELVVDGERRTGCAAPA